MTSVSTRAYEQDDTSSASTKRHRPFYMPPLSIITIPGVFEVIIQFLSFRIKLVHMTHICHSITLTPRCFLFDHMIFNQFKAPSILATVTQSPSRMLLLSCLPSIHYIAGDVHHSALLGCLQSAPHFLSNLRCCSLDLSFEAHHREPRVNGVIVNPASHLLECLSTCCTQLSSLALRSSNFRFSLRHLIDCLQRMHNLTALQISGCGTGYGSGFCMDDQSLTALLALPLKYIDLAACLFIVSDEEREELGLEPLQHHNISSSHLLALPGTLTTLLLPCSIEVLDVDSEQTRFWGLLSEFSHLGQQGRGLHTLSYNLVEDDEIVDSECLTNLRGFLHSQRALTNLMLECNHQNLEFLLDNANGNGTDSDEIILPLLSEFSYHSSETDYVLVDALQSCLTLRALAVFGHQLRRLELLELPDAVVVDSVFSACATHCRLLQSLTISLNIGVGQPRLLSTSDTKSVSQYPCLMQLEELSVQNYFTTEQQLLLIVCACPALHCLHVQQLERYSLVSFAVLPKIGEVCRNLKELTLYGFCVVEGAPDPAVSSSSASTHSGTVAFPSLKTLDMDRVSEANMAQFSISWMLSVLQSVPLQILTFPCSSEPPVLAALAILTAFPSLRSLQHAPSRFMHCSNRWSGSLIEAESRVKSGVQGESACTHIMADQSYCPEFIEEEVLQLNTKEGGIKWVGGREAFMESLREQIVTEIC